MGAVKLKRWSREEYDRLVAAGILSPESQVELVDGEIVEKMPQNLAAVPTVRIPVASLLP